MQAVHAPSLDTGAHAGVVDVDPPAPPVLLLVPVVPPQAAGSVALAPSATTKYATTGPRMASASYGQAVLRATAVPAFAASQGFW